MSANRVVEHCKRGARDVLTGDSDLQTPCGAELQRPCVMPASISGEKEIIVDDAHVMSPREF